jgi:O-methyltransferase
MIAHEIYEKNIPGNVAELGVFQGDFAKYMNVLFKDRVLYLFDTFEGFDARDVKTEVGKDLSDGQEDFSRTSVELVMKKMRHPHNCIVKRGFFPETAQGLDDTFSFVSVDADLYQPIYEGLRYFYPRLSTRGFMLIHDFNNRLYPGARKAVDDFCREEGVGVFPLFDSGGSAVLVKHSCLTGPEGLRR